MLRAQVGKHRTALGPYGQARIPDVPVPQPLQSKVLVATALSSWGNASRRRHPQQRVGVHLQTLRSLHGQATGFGAGTPRLGVFVAEKGAAVVSRICWWGAWEHGDKPIPAGEGSRGLTCRHQFPPASTATRATAGPTGQASLQGIVQKEVSTYWGDPEGPTGGRGSRARPGCPRRVRRASCAGGEGRDWLGALIQNLTALADWGPSGRGHQRHGWGALSPVHEESLRAVAAASPSCKE